MAYVKELRARLKAKLRDSEGAESSGRGVSVVPHVLGFRSPTNSLGKNVHSGSSNAGGRSPTRCSVGAKKQ